MRPGSFAIVAIGVLAAAPEFAAAQRRPPLPPPPVSLAVPHPIPPISTSPAPPRDLYQLTPPQSMPPAPPTDLYQRLTPPHRIPLMIRGAGFGYGVFAPSGYGYTPYGYTPSVDTAPTPMTVPLGALRFETAPGSAQVYVDGYYLGLIDDFGLAGHALDLEAGPHRIEVRESGYVTLAFEVNITPNQTIRYRGDLQRLAAPQPPPPAPMPTPTPTPRTTYVIPNCYAGDRPPTRPLPRGCDIKQLQTRN